MDVVLSKSFKKCVRKFQKRFPHVKDDVKSAIHLLQDNPQLGDVIPGSFGVRKFRIMNSDLRRGKSAGYRLLYLFELEPTPRLVMILLYAKSDRADVTERELKQLLKELALDSP